MQRGPALETLDRDAPGEQETPGAGRSSGTPAPLRTEFDFELPRGFVDADGVRHTRGTMRLATARDELLPLYDSRVQENAAFTTVVLLSRVITSLGSMSSISTNVVENMFASDVAFLQDFYRRVNAEGHTKAAVTCPECSHRFTIDLAGGRLGES
ncbi:hypothetical protein [Cellulosimicrobium arenosum]|uniref:Secreted protein n=1 Tax=Cellulosimicrobium arenosum TaxID=2708133 RepID=A0A927J1V4_9MICO|nr:hypothetical protein [Cellulosimicrobium arenosum]MBD8080363.1 hypothetical protein [Cellulosimicrobium arenosum]